MKNTDAPAGQSAQATSIPHPGAMDDAPTSGIARSRDGQVYHLMRDMDVLAADGVRVGTVKEVHPAEILVNRPLKRDIYVPFDALQGVVNNQLVLTVPAEQVDSMGWPHPDLIGG